ncbi:NADP-dependent oxidoreductase [Hamadaea tsunoensis]|uniref:NADP-dependent oxidoreductase n=1 Tax=Hamadaea tsunoensis TaxID=53368 RepID=UPI000484B315|nr:NADP-dependent oxidoreductase [Hamadaea tsunoensis]
MRAIVIDDFGAAPTVAEIPDPVPGPGEVRVKVRVASLNGFDLAMARGWLRGMMDHEFPATLGRDFAGTVDAVGEGVSAYAPGDEVFGVVLTQPLHHGSFADHLVIPADHNIAPIPAGVDLLRAGTIGLAGAAALASLGAVAPHRGDLVLVSGATGGVGAAAIQLAVQAGAEVIATAAPGGEAAFVRELGAVHVVDYTGDVAAQVRQLAPGGIAAALHYAGDPDVLAGVLMEGGRYATLLSALPSGDLPITAVPIYATPHREVLEHLGALVAGGELRLPVQRTYSLDAVPKALEDFAAGTLGKLAVVID